MPEADLYVCTGDMLSNFPVKDRDPGSYTYRSLRIDPKHEVEMQMRQVNQFIANGGMRPRLGNPDGMVVCVRGNHDFIDIAGLFTGCDLVHEFKHNELVVIEKLGGLRITGHRGIPRIYGGWNDEIERPELIQMVRDMPAADLFLTHYPPYGMLDTLAGPHSSDPTRDPVGLEGMMNMLMHKVQGEYKLTDDGLNEHEPIRAAHCFGHIHEWGGYKTQAVDVMFSNAAQTINTFDIELR